MATGGRSVAIPQVSARAALRRGWDDLRATSLISDHWVETPDLIERPDGDDRMALPVLIFFNARCWYRGTQPSWGEPGDRSEFTFTVVGLAFDLTPHDPEPAPLTADERARVLNWFECAYPEICEQVEES